RGQVWVENERLLLRGPLHPVGALDNVFHWEKTGQTYQGAYVVYTHAALGKLLGDTLFFNISQPKVGNLVSGVFGTRCAMYSLEPLLNAALSKTELGSARQTQNQCNSLTSSGKPYQSHRSLANNSPT